MTWTRGAGSLRQRRAGVWEVRVALGPDLVSGRSVTRSVTVYGDRRDAEEARARWAARAALARSARRPRPAITLAELLSLWLDAEHGWRPSTITGYRSTVGFLSRDAIGRRRAADLTPRVLRAALAAWTREGFQEPTQWGRVRVLRSALGWAHTEGVLDDDPLYGMRGPPQPGVRLHAPVDAVRDILGHAAAQIEVAAQIVQGYGAGGGAALAGSRLHRAEQVLLLVRLAADSGARRGELAALQLEDLDGEVLTIERAISNEQLGPTKSGRVRRLTLGPTTASLWHDTVETWRQRADGHVGPWLFSRRGDHAQRLTTSALGHWFAGAATEAGHSDVTLHRLRHTVATALVGQGDILGAQYRLGHRDASTTLRIYAHAMPLTDAEAAQTLDRLYALS